MRKTFCKQNMAMVMALLVIILLCVICSSLGIVYAEERVQNNLNIIHISDLHYYPTYMCYKQNDSDYLSSAMYEKSKFESKLLTESSSVIKKLFANIYEQAPDYVVVTGDLSSDGEKEALIEIANGLRDLQNRVRAKGNANKNFQIFVIPGNHDILNENAMDYSEAGGIKLNPVNRAEFAKIFAGLGYPEMSTGEAGVFYSDYSIENDNLKYLPYDAENGNYVYSELASNLDFTWTPALTANSTQLSQGDLSYYVNCLNLNKFTLLGLDGLVDGKVGGKVEDGVFEWLNGEKGKFTNNIISLTHQNVIPHFTMQERWTKNYLYSNWELVRDSLLKLGVKYNFSGHMHANDIASFCNFDGHTLYDIETGSPVGYGANYRNIDISFYQNGAQDVAQDVASNMTQTLKEISNVDITLLLENGYILDDNQLYINNKVIDDLAEYIDVNLYDNMLTGVLDSVIKYIDKDNFVNFVIESIDKYLDKGLAKNVIKDNSTALRKVIGNLYTQIEAKTLADFVYTGNKKFLQGDDNKLRAYIYTFAEQLINLKIIDDYTVQNMFVDAYTTHLKGGEGIELAGINENLIFSIEEWMPSGRFVESIVDEMRSGNNSMIKLIKQVLTTNYNLTTGISSDEIRDLSGILNFFGIDLKAFNLDKFIQKFAGDKLKELPSELVDKQIDYILTQSIAKGIGENVSDVIRSLVTDTTYDGVPGVPSKVLFDSTDEYTHYSGGKKRSPSITDGRLPSMLTMTFGENKALDRNLVWFTEKNVTETQIQISEGDRTAFNPTAIGSVVADCEIIKVDKPLIDIGIITTYTTQELARHTLQITGLKANTLYTYRVGGGKYFSDYYTFKTGSNAEKMPFEMLIMTDMQGMSVTAYQNTAKLIKASHRVSTFGYDFAINLGDLVDSGKNLNQWQYLLNSNTQFFGTIPQVIATGNHDISVKIDNENNYKIDTASGRSPLDIYFNFNQNYYSFDYSNVHFIILDTNDIVNDNLNYVQVEWLKNDLEQNSDKLKVVAMHKGIYSAGPHKDDIEIVNMRKVLSKIFSDYKVELVLQGHDHIYSESFFLDGEGKKIKTPAYKQGSPINNNNGGVLYMTMGVSGDKYYDFDSDTDAFISKGKLFQSPKLNNPTFGKLLFDGENISFTSYQYDLQKDSVEQLVMFNTNIINLIISIVVAVIIVVGIILLVILLLRNHKKKIAQCKAEDFEN